MRGRRHCEPPQYPLLFGGAKALVPAMISRGESFDLRGGLAASCPSPQPSPAGEGASNDETPSLCWGAGGVKRHSQYVGPMRPFRRVQPARNRAPGCGYAGIPPLPPLLKGGTTRNGIRMKTRLVQVELFITTPLPPLLKGGTTPTESG